MQVRVRTLAGATAQSPRLIRSRRSGILELLALELRGIALVEEAVLDLDPIRDVLAGNVLVHRLERDRPEERARLDRCPERPVDDRIEGGVRAVDRDQDHILTRRAA